MIWYVEAMQSDDVESWKQAMNDKMIALEDNDTFVLNELPEGVKPVGAIWVLQKRKVVVMKYTKLVL